MDKDIKDIDAPASGRILSMDMGKHVADCYSGDIQPCRSACPLNLNIPEFITRLQRGNFKSAYGLLRDHVIFPEIVRHICGQTCMDACARKSVDGAVNLQKLEKAAIDFAGSTAPIRYNMPGKNKTVAVVGAGLCGLSCTVRLASRGYGVVIFEKTGRLGGRLWDLLPDGKFMEEISLQTGHISCELRMETPATSLDDFREFDAVLLACGVGGENFGLLETMNRDSLCSEREGIFLGGGLIEGTPVESIENGIRAAQSIESYLKIGRMHEMSGVSVKKPSRLRVNANRFNPADRPLSEVYTREEAVLEAESCPRCDCNDCMRSCDFMKAYKKLPKKIVNDVRVRLNPIEGLQGGTGTRMISSCNTCGLCAEVCGEDIDMGDFLLKARSIMHREGSLPAVFHDFWMRDMHHAQGEKAFLARLAPGSEKSRYLFFPGCQLGAAEPAYVEKTYEYLREKLPDSGLLLGCCGAPSEWAGNERSMDEVAGSIRKIFGDMGKPEVILACPTCEKMFRKHLPEIKQISLYKIICECGLPEELPRGGGGGGGAVSVFDPCSSRYDADMQKSVREIISQTGRYVEELPYSGREAACCGFGGHIYPANPELTEKIARNRIELSPYPFVTYCANCRDIFSERGKECVHVLDLIFDTGGKARPVPSLSRRRENREGLKKRLLRRVWEESVMEEKKKYKIVLEPGLEEKLGRLLILEDDIRETVDYCEETHSKLLDPATGFFVGHRKLGAVTYWVEYRMDGGGGSCEVRNAYSHRMRIREE